MEEEKENEDRCRGEKMKRGGDTDEERREAREEVKRTRDKWRVQEESVCVKEKIKRE